MPKRKTKKSNKIFLKPLVAGIALVSFACLVLFFVTIWRKNNSANINTAANSWLSTGFDWGALDKSVYQIPEKLNPRGLNVVFVSDGFENNGEFKNSVNGIIENDFKKYEPWKSYKDFNFFSVYNNDSSVCQIKERDSFAPVLKCSQKLIDMVSVLPLARLKVIVVSRQNFVSWSNLARLDNSFVFYSFSRDKEDKKDEFTYKILMHEFGHSFGLRDETRSIVAIAGSAPSLPEGPNCAPDVETAKRWWGGMLKNANGNLVFDSTKNDTGFYFGCAGNDSYIRPTQKSFMNIQDFPGADSYGAVSQSYLKKILDFCFSDKIYREKDDPEFFAQYSAFKECIQ